MLSEAVLVLVFGIELEGSGKRPITSTSAAVTG